MVDAIKGKGGWMHISMLENFIFGIVGAQISIRTRLAFA